MSKIYYQLILKLPLRFIYHLENSFREVQTHQTYSGDSRFVFFVHKRGLLSKFLVFFLSFWHNKMREWEIIRYLDLIYKIDQQKNIKKTYFSFNKKDSYYFFIIK